MARSLNAASGESAGPPETACAVIGTMGVRSLRVPVEGGSCLDRRHDGNSDLWFASLTMAVGLSIWRQGSGDFDMCGIAVTATTWPGCVCGRHFRIFRRARLGRPRLRAFVEQMRWNGIAHLSKRPCVASRPPTAAGVADTREVPRGRQMTSGAKRTLQRSSRLCQRNGLSRMHDCLGMEGCLHGLPFHRRRIGHGALNCEAAQC